jgi:4-hydroxy-2-oxoheptanedioate aldolase
MDASMIPMLISQGFGAIAVSMDVWGLANLVHGNLKQGRECAQQASEAKKAEINGKVTTNGTTKISVTANGKANSS